MCVGNTNLYCNAFYFLPVEKTNTQIVQPNPSLRFFLRTCNLLNGHYTFIDIYFEVLLANNRDFE